MYLCLKNKLHKSKIKPKRKFQVDLSRAGQEIEVHDLQWNQGILALDFGVCKLIKTYNNPIHIIDLSAYKEGTKTLENNIKSFKNLPDVEKT